MADAERWLVDIAFAPAPSAALASSSLPAAASAAALSHYLDGVQL
jgi:hypothetical protein